MVRQKKTAVRVPVGWGPAVGPSTTPASRANLVKSEINKSKVAVKTQTTASKAPRVVRACVRARVRADVCARMFELLQM